MKVDSVLVQSLASQISQKINEKPTVAIILGSGLADIADNLENKVIIKYEELSGMPICYWKNARKASDCNAR